jgi:RNA polymerase sigma-70 factor (ECF subfamily)
MDQHLSGRAFIENLVQHQNSLYAYILTVLPNTDDARDVLQETALELWSRAEEFRENGNFLAWACRFAYFKVLAFRRDRGRERLLFSDELLTELASAAAAEAALGDPARAALDECLAALPRAQSDLILERYGPGGSVKKMAAERNRSAQGLGVTLHRIRQALMACVQGKLVEKGT